MQIRPKIYNVGVCECNSYLIIGDKTALIDTVRNDYVYNYTEKFIENIEKIIPVSKIDYLIFNHTGLDRSGAAKLILERNPNIEVIATIAGIRNLKEITNIPFNERIAKDNSEIDLGGFTLKFMTTPNLDWPDSMVTYEKNSKTLFSCDMFSGIWADNDLIRSLSIYFLCLRPFREYVLSALDIISELDIDIICPGSGKIIENDAIDAAVNAYREWSTPKEKHGKNIVILYASADGATHEMAETVQKALEVMNIKTVMLDAHKACESEDIRLINESDALVVGTNTWNRNADKWVMQFITELDTISLHNKPFFVFGSYGWSGEGVQIVHSLLTQMRLKPFSKPFMSIFNLSDERRGELIKHTQKFAENIYNEN